MSISSRKKRRRKPREVEMEDDDYLVDNSLRDV